MAIVQEAYSPVQISASANVCSGPAVVGLIFCSSSSSATLTLYDDTSTGTSTKAVDTFTLTAGTPYPMAYSFSKGVYAVISGTGSITIGLVRMA